MEDEMELMDWKELESAGEGMIRQALKDKVVGECLLGRAIIMIKKLKGKTNDELNKEAKVVSV